MLEGKAVVVTGSGNGIGAACAMGIARQGASVVVNDVDSAAAEATVRAIRDNGGTAITHVADVSSWEEAGGLIRACVGAYGQIDGLVNNAALFTVAPCQDFDPLTARAVIEVNILGPMHCIGHALPLMLARGKGSIVSMVSGAHMGMRDMGIYGATKGAVASMIYTYAMELAGTGVRMNGISPFGATNIQQNSKRYISQRTNRPLEPVAERPAANIQPPSDNSPVVEFLLSDAAANVNGQLLRMDRGELSLYTHPALLLPPVHDPDWTAAKIAEAFAKDFGHRQVGCGVLGMEAGPVELKTGFWSRQKASETAAAD